MFQQGIKLYKHEKKQARKILEEIIDLEEFRDDFVDPLSKEEQEKRKKEGIYNNR